MGNETHIIYIIFLVFILSACQQKNDTNYYLSLMGESESWKILNYEVMITNEGMKVGNGTLMMKDIEEYETDSFSFSTYIVKNGEEERIHGGSVSGQADLTNQTTGTIEGTDGFTLQFNEIQQIYMIVEWWDVDKKEDLSEEIILFERTVDEPSFLTE